MSLVSNKRDDYHGLSINFKERNSELCVEHAFYPIEVMLVCSLPRMSKVLYVGAAFNTALMVMR